MEPLPFESEPFLKLSEVSREIREAIDGRFGSRLVWVVAEISDLNVRKGHCYLSLVEKPPGAAAPICELKGIIWAGKYDRISDRFQQGTGISLASGTIILFRAAVRFDVKWGLSLIIEEIEPRYTIGLIAQERERTILRLKQEGIFDNNKKIPFPLVPSRIAILSASDSKGFIDFREKLTCNPYGYRYRVTLFPTPLQGDKAAGEMVNQLIRIFHRMDEFDLVVIVRGGGESVDLNCFNDYKLARAVARFPLPVLTGIGHTVNVSVTDEVAYADRITPTDAADFIVEKTFEFESRLIEIGQQIRDLVSLLAEEERERITSAEGMLKSIALKLVGDENTLINTLAGDLFNITAREIREQQMSISNRSLNLGHLASRLVMVESGRLTSHGRMLVALPSKLIRQATLKMDRLEATTGHLDPVNVLRRGFSITLSHGRAVKNAADLRAGDRIKTLFYEGKIESEVRE